MYFVGAGREAYMDEKAHTIAGLIIPSSICIVRYPNVQIPRNNFLADYEEEQREMLCQTLVEQGYRVPPHIVDISLNRYL